MKVKLIALDIDGTIIDKQSGVPVHKIVREAVSDARKAGIKVCLCSARPSCFMQDATRELDEIDALIGCAGAEIKTNGKSWHKVPIPVSALRACFVTAKRMDLYVSFAGDEKILVCKKGPVSAPLEQGSVFVVVSDEELLEAVEKEDFYCAFIFTEEDTPKEKIFTDTRFETVNIYKSSQNSFNLTKKGTNKGTGILLLAEHWGIPREAILAIGNDGNDIPMFEAAGVSAAVSNASPEALAAADWIVPDVRHGGAAEAIKRFALL